MIANTVSRSEGAVDAFSKLHPVGGIGNPCIVANAAVFFASDDVKWIASADFPVDGGITAL